VQVEVLAHHGHLTVSRERMRLLGPGRGNGQHGNCGESCEGFQTEHRRPPSVEFRLSDRRVKNLTAKTQEVSARLRLARGTSRQLHKRTHTSRLKIFQNRPIPRSSDASSRPYQARR